MSSLLESFGNGLLTVLEWPTMGLMLIGLVVGFVIGVIPGLGGVVTFAILLPFTFGMEPAAAFAMLLAMSSVSSTTGDITSILFGVPGEASSASLVVDGYPMSKRGEAGRALSAVLVSSLVGAIIGAFALLAVLPFARAFVLAIGSPEFLLLTVLGLTFVASLSSGAVSKGLVAALFGVLLATIGLAPQSGVPRYTFGLLELWDGIGLVAAAVGLFAIPELYLLAVKRTSIAEHALGKLTGLRKGIKDVWVHGWLAIRTSVIGTLIGILPGMGSSIAQWVSYGHALQSSRDKERFGKGAVEGVIGPGAANNSGLGGSLIPLLVFGIPGSVFTALLLGAMLIHGLRPGPEMLTTNIDLTMSFVWVIVISNLLAVLIAMPFLRHIAKLTVVRGSLLIPIITFLIYVGAFGEKNAMLDIVVALGFGALGIVMMALGWPRPPLILGLVLGGLAERYLFLSTERYGAAFLIRPSVVVLGLICILVLLVPALRRMRAKSAPERDEAEKVNARFASRVDWSLALTIVFLAVGVAALGETFQWSYRTSLVPKVVASTLVALTAGLVITQLAGWHRRSRARLDLGIGEIDPTAIRSRTTIFVLWLVLALAAVWLLGFVIGSVVLAFGYLTLVGRERFSISTAAALGLGTTFWVFREILHLPLFGGILIG